MKITFVLPHAGLGGGTKVVATHAHELTCLGHVVKVVSTPRAPAPLKERVRRFIRGQGKMHTLSHFDGLDVDHHIIESFRPIVDSDVPDADAIVATWWETAEWVNRMNKRKGSKFYFVQHHEIFDYLPIERCKATYKMPLRKIVVSKWLQDVLRENYNEDSDIVPNSINRSLFFSQDRQKQDLPTVGFLYAPMPDKGLAATLTAVQSLKERFQQLRVFSFGSDGVVPQFTLPNFATYKRTPPQEEIRTIYSSCDVWLTASLSEGFNLPAIEAMACGTPLVSTRTGWPIEAIRNGENGYLIDSPSELAQRAAEILSLDRPSWKAISENAVATVSTSSWQNSAKLFEACLQRRLQQEE